MKTLAVVLFLVCGGALITACYLLGRDLDSAFDELNKPAVVCKVCHCQKTSCHRECGEENMCNMQCNQLCQKENR